ncbi:MAG: tRNA (uridine(34)/cytosine(34)/5-carboxymethylaminomethyluridine(34)-2'-O)-methyltransferase TrmL [Proteobacteria bacterium]|nr:tRNA (uridine(34)/cytosine(34)/5-carboxymethylaminomethyluridine(34)-2'-O)-methyltransferase TrmL [Pseudomonadota bacterium]
MFHIALFEPEIPPNTGNVMRLCANTGAHLHLIEPLGFDLDDKQLRRAGLDYREYASVSTHESLSSLIRTLTPGRILAVTTKGETTYTDITYHFDDLILFGPETRGLPEAILNDLPVDQRIRIPMLGSSRSLNLSNAVAVVVYEAWRQSGFTGADRVA